MRHFLLFFTLFFCVAVTPPLSPAQAQDLQIVDKKSPKKALTLNLLLPGLGHRYVHDGSWKSAATFYALADVGLWLGLIGAETRYNDLITNYTTLAASRANAFVDGKDRQFFLNLASYHSSDEYLETQLRNRNWTKLDYVEDRDFQWSWDTEEDYLTFRGMREDAESMRRRRIVFITVLVANRLVSGLAGIRAANRANAVLHDVAISLTPPSYNSSLPVLHLNMHF